MLGHCLRRWSDIETLLTKCILIIICRGAQRVLVWSRLLQIAPIDWSKLNCTMNGASLNMCIIEPTSIHIVILKILNKPEEKMGILNKDIAHLPNTSGSLCQGLKLIGWKNSGRNNTSIFGHSYRGKKTKKNQIKLNIIGHSSNIISIIGKHIIKTCTCS